jgi:hypothetical protein
MSADKVQRRYLVIVDGTVGKLCTPLEIQTPPRESTQRQS